MLTYKFSDDLLCAGQPTEADLHGLKNQGYRCVVNLRPPNEPGQIPQAEAVAQKLGLAYRSFPVVGPTDLNEENTRRFDALLQEIPRPAMIHCGSSNRVGALMRCAQPTYNKKTKTKRSPRVGKRV